MGFDQPPRAEHLPPGYDNENPYADEDISQYPEWWRRNIEQFREHELRPYRPPRFTDDEYTPNVITKLEADLDVDVLIRAIEPRVGDDWSVSVDGEVVTTIGRHRSGDGYTVYELSSDEFESIVRSAIE